jgi:hypothetical protein
VPFQDLIFPDSVAAIPERYDQQLSVSHFPTEYPCMRGQSERFAPADPKLVANRLPVYVQRKCHEDGSGEKPQPLGIQGHFTAGKVTEGGLLPL